MNHFKSPVPVLAEPFGRCVRLRDEADGEARASNRPRLMKRRLTRLTIGSNARGG